MKDIPILKLRYILNAKYLSYRFKGINKIITHLTNKEKIELYYVVRNIQRKNIVCVEIGSYLGASTCFIASAINKDGKLFCVDTWANDNMIYDGDDPEDENLTPKDTYNDFLNNTRRYKNKITAIQKWSAEAIEDIKLQTNIIDFLFIDGDHTYEGVKKDWDLYRPLLQKGSIIAFHDTAWAVGVQKVIKEEVISCSKIILNLTNMQIYQLT